MAITTSEEARASVNKWLSENGHNVNGIKDDNSSFHYEIDYPLGSMKRQRVLQPKQYVDLVVLLNGVAIADEHKESLKQLTEDEREAFYSDVRKALLFVDNSIEMDIDEEGIVQQVQFSYEFYFDALTKTNLFRGLLMNHRALLYIVTTFNDRFGVPAMPEGDTPIQ